MEWNRDIRLPVAAIRSREEGLTDKRDRAKGTVSLPELRKGNIGLVVATQIARFVSPDNPLPGWHSPEQAWAQTCRGNLPGTGLWRLKVKMIMIKGFDRPRKTPCFMGTTMNRMIKNPLVIS